VRVDEAKAMVLDLISADLRLSGSSVQLSAVSPDMRDHGKFVLDGKAARVIHHFSGWHPGINTSWFSGSFDPPRVWGSDFYWYVIAIPRLTTRRHRDHYFICDYLQMRDWVLGFAAPLGKDHRDHNDWRADLRVFVDDGTEQTGYFRWGDEPVGSTALASRVISLDNVTTIGDVALAGLHVGLFGPGGESADHKHLKLYVATHPLEFGLSAAARSTVEYGFRTGDRVDVLYENHAPERTVIEVEIEGEENVCVGIHQAVKYRSLAEVDGGYPLQGANVRSLVVAYQAEYPKTVQLARRYDVSLQSVERQLVLASAL
jgi:hypothetical protein